MRTRIISMLLIVMFTITACRSTSATVTPSVPPTQAVTVAPVQNTAVPAKIAGTSTPAATPTSSSLVYPPPGAAAAATNTPAATPASRPDIAGLQSAILLDDTQQHKSILAYYDPALWKASSSENFNATLSGQALTSSTLSGCTLHYTGGFEPDASWKAESVEGILNPSVTLYEIFKQAGSEVLRLYRVDTYDSAFAVRLDGVDAASQGKCVQQTEHILATIVVQSIYP